MTILLLASGGTLSIGLLFWILMIVAVVFGAWIGWPVAGAPNGWRPFGFNLLLWVLLFLLGWGVFGAPIGGR
jgi:hypothetical protein